MQPLLTTPLYAAHRASGARMADFAGWEMPIHYGSQLEEHRQVRNDAGMFDVSHMRIVDIAGDAAQDWLRRLLANDVARLITPGKALYSCMLREDGGILDDLIVYLLAPGQYRIVVNAGTAQKDIAWMRAQNRDGSLRITEQTALAMIAVQGPQARARFIQAQPACATLLAQLPTFHAAWHADWLIARTGYTGEDGLEIALPEHAAPALWQTLQAAGVMPCGLGARDTLRLEAGMNLYGQDMDETVTPQESNLAWTVCLRDPTRRFIGREALQALTPSRQLLGLRLLDKGILRAGQEVNTAHGPGRTTSGSFSPTLNASIALARMPVAVRPGERVTVSIRDKMHQAEVVTPPFARHGKSLLPPVPLPS